MISVFHKIIGFWNRDILEDLNDLDHYITHLLIKHTIIPHGDLLGKTEINIKSLKQVQLTGRKEMDNFFEKS